MKRLILLFLVVFSVSNISLAQSVLPNITVSKLGGTKISLNEFVKEGKPLVISFWATWCKPCNNELSEISDVYNEWLADADFNFLAVSIDDSRSIAKVKSMVNGKEWPFTIILDQNQDLKRMLNVSNIPHLFIFDSKGKLEYQHKGYVPGNEQEVINKLISLQN